MLPFIYPAPTDELGNIINKELDYILIANAPELSAEDIVCRYIDKLTG